MEDIQKSIVAATERLFEVRTDVILTRPEPEFGDFATNVALQISKNLGKNPREVAEQLVKELEGKLTKVVSEFSIAGPGFINIKLTESHLIDQLDTQPEESPSKQVVVIETNNPNPFKAMHIGHAFNAILGDTIANLLEARGGEVHRVSYHGDVGLHVGKSMYSLLNFVGDDASKLGDIQSDDRNSFMSRMYAEGSKAYKDDPAAKEVIDELTKQSFTREDPLYAQVYDTCKAWSFEQIDDLVARLGNVPIEKRYLEGEADDRGVAVVRANVPKVFKESDGALVFEGSKFGSFDNVFVSSKGRGLYGARDLGLILMKDETYHPDQSYIVTAEEQRDYFKGVLAAVALCFPEQKDKTKNISTGTVKLTTGKMSSRSGDVLEISWLFDQVSEAIQARGGEADDRFVTGVLRYQFLKVRIGSDVIFDINEAASLDGNSGPYLQYAHARARSILGKSQITATKIRSLDQQERRLVLKLTEYSEVKAKATSDLLPHIICTYLYELAQTFNRFYEVSRVIDDPREAERLYLVEQYANTLKEGLELLGIHAPEKM